LGWTEGLRRICTDDTDLRTGNGNDKIQGFFPFDKLRVKMTTGPATANAKADPYGMTTKTPATGYLDWLIW
jgi:hypothetical protein